MSKLSAQRLHVTRAMFKLQSIQDLHLLFFTTSLGPATSSIQDLQCSAVQCSSGPAPSLFFSTSAWHCQSASGTNSSFVRHCIYAECAQKPALHRFYVFTFHQKQLILATFLPRHCFHGTMFQIIWYHIKSIEGFNTTWFCSFWLSWKDWIEPYLTSRNDCMYLNRHIPFWRKSILPPWSQVCNPRIAS